MATQLASRVRDQFDLEIPLRTIFEHPTVAGLGSQLDNLTWAAEGRRSRSDGTEGQEVGEL